MAEEKPAKVPKAPRKRKTPDTVREHAEKQSAKRASDEKPSKLKGKIVRPFSALNAIGKKEFNPVKAPDKKGVKHLNKRVRIIPKFIRESWAEVKLVTWPTKKVAAKLTGAVFIFAIALTIFIQIIDYVFNKLAKEILLK